MTEPVRYIYGPEHCDHEPVVYTTETPKETPMSDLTPATLDDPARDMTFSELGLDVRQGANGGALVYITDQQTQQQMGLLLSPHEAKRVALALMQHAEDIPTESIV